MGHVKKQKKGTLKGDKMESKFIEKKSEILLVLVFVVVVLILLFSFLTLKDEFNYELKYEREKFGSENINGFLVVGEIRGVLEKVEVVEQGSSYGQNYTILTFDDKRVILLRGVVLGPEKAFKLGSFNVIKYGSDYMILSVTQP